MKKKLISALLIGVMSMSALAGCGSGKSLEETPAATDGSDSQKTESTDEEFSMADAKDVSGTEISFWHSMGGVNGQAIDALVEKFNEENEYGITVNAQYQGEYDDSLNKLKSAQIGNMGADLVQVYEIGTRFMIESGWITPMQNMVDADNYDLSQIEPNLAAYYTIDDELYSMPFNSSTPIMYYNKDMFEKAGITEIPDSLEAIEAVGDKLLSDGGAGKVMSLSIYGWFFEQSISHPQSAARIFERRGQFVERGPDRLPRRVPRRVPGRGGAVGDPHRPAEPPRGRLGVLREIAVEQGVVLFVGEEAQLEQRGSHDGARVDAEIPVVLRGPLAHPPVPHRRNGEQLGQDVLRLLHGRPVGAAVHPQAHAARGGARCVAVEAQEVGAARLVGDAAAFGDRQGRVRIAGEHHAEPLRLQQRLEGAREAQDVVLFVPAFEHCAGVGAAVPRVKADFYDRASLPSVRRSRRGAA